MPSRTRLFINLGRCKNTFKLTLKISVMGYGLEESELTGDVASCSEHHRKTSGCVESG
jgi:hypothetical protein